MSNDAIAIVKQVGDVAAASVTVLTVFKLLPAIAAGFAIVWYSVALYEKITGKQFSESWLAKFLSGN